MRIQLAYSTTLLIAAETLSRPLTPAPALAATWLQFSKPPLNMVATAFPVAYERRRIRGFIDTDVAGTLNVLFSDDASTTRVTATFAVPGNGVGAGSTFDIQVPGGKYVRMTYVNGAVGQARFCLLLNMEESVD